MNINWIQRGTQVWLQRYELLFFSWHAIPFFTLYFLLSFLCHQGFFTANEMLQNSVKQKMSIQSDLTLNTLHVVYLICLNLSVGLYATVSIFVYYCFSLDIFEIVPVPTSCHSKWWTHTWFCSWSSPIETSYNATLAPFLSHYSFYLL